MKRKQKKDTLYIPIIRQTVAKSSATRFVVGLVFFLFFFSVGGFFFFFRQVVNARDSSVRVVIWSPLFSTVVGVYPQRADRLMETKNEVIVENLVRSTKFCRGFVTARKFTTRQCHRRHYSLRSTDSRWVVCILFYFIFFSNKYLFIYFPSSFDCYYLFRFFFSFRRKKSRERTVRRTRTCRRTSESRTDSLTERLRGTRRGESVLGSSRRLAHARLCPRRADRVRVVGEPNERATGSVTLQPSRSFDLFVVLRIFSHSRTRK